MSKLPVTAIVMTYNEEINLPECLESIALFVDDIIIIDSFSSDKTLDIARSYTEKIHQHSFINQAKQFNWALANTEIKNEWILRLDADERWTPEGFAELREIVMGGRADGVFVKMKIFFMGTWIRFGGFYPNNFLRVYKKTKGTIEDRWMDEHIHVDGLTIESNIDVLEANYDRQKNLVLWTTKHNNYSTREAVEFLCQKHRLVQIETIGNFFGNKIERKRWLKENFYFITPLFVRPFLYFIYRYFFKLGFLDGKEGFVFHTLHAFWYRFLVDAKILQVERNAKAEGISIKEAIKIHYGINL
jgi:glycosyltransferase involved in cell wall biosynthesis